MISKFLYYINKIFVHLFKTFSIRRIRKFGFKLAILDFIIFLLRRNNSKFEHYCIKEKDKIVQQYIKKEYKEIIEEAKGVESE